MKLSGTPHSSPKSSPEEDEEVVLGAAVTEPQVIEYVVAVAS